MNLADIGKTLESAAPLVASLLAGPEAGAAVELLTKTLGCKSDPESLSAAIAAPGAWDKVRLADLANADHLQTLLAAQQARQTEADSAALAQVNTTMRAEDGAGRGRWRDLFGYVAALAFAVEVLAVVGIFIYAAVATVRGVPAANLAALKDLVTGLVAALTPVWMVAGGVLGIDTWHKGTVARIQAGDTSMSAAIAARLGGDT